jgi:aminoglycoside phosphotransferase (APT) family kinase protein
MLAAAAVAAAAGEGGAAVASSGGRTCAASDYVSMSYGNSPSIVLDFLEGRPADKVLVLGDATDPTISERVVTGAGAALAALHAVPLPDSSELAGTGLRDAGGGGSNTYPGPDPAAACNVGQHKQFAAEFAQVDCVVHGHPFIALHAEQLDALVATMEQPLPRGLIHGDPFMDNLLAKDTGEVVGWVDWEDVCIGPLMFDVGCALIGCCYRSSEGKVLVVGQEFALKGGIGSHDYCWV